MGRELHGRLSGFRPIDLFGLLVLVCLVFIFFILFLLLFADIGDILNDDHPWERADFQSDRDQYAAAG